MGGRGDGTYRTRIRKDPDRDEDKEPSEYDDYRDYIQKTALKPDYWSKEAREAWKARHPDWSEPAPDRTAWTDHDYESWEYQHPGWFEDTGLENPNPPAPSTIFPHLHNPTPAEQEDHQALQDDYSALPPDATIEDALAITRDWLDRHTVNLSAGDGIPTDLPHSEHFSATTVAGVTIQYEKSPDDAYLDSVLHDLNAAIQLLILLRLPPLVKASINSVIIAQSAPEAPDTLDTTPAQQIVIQKPNEHRMNEALDWTSLARASGYALALRVYGSQTPPAFSDYAQALQGSEPPINEVAATNRANDFAEAVALYITHPERLKRIAPERFKVIARLMADPDYSG